MLQDGLGPLLSKWLCKKLCDSESGFSLMFNETTTVQNQKSMDVLLSYWDKDEKQVVTKYSTSLFFARAKAVNVTKMILDFHDNSMFNLAWNYLYNIISDGSNINKDIWSELYGGLKERGHKGLVEFVNCTLYIIHNGFRKGIAAKGGLGKTIEQLAFNLHAWFKIVNIFMFFEINFLKKFVKIAISFYVSRHIISRHNVSRHKTISSKYNIKFY